MRNEIEQYRDATNGLNVVRVKQVTTKQTNVTQKKILRHISGIQFRAREASHTDFVHEERHMDVLLETPPPR